LKGEVPSQEPWVTEEVNSAHLMMRQLPRVFFAEKQKSGRWWAKMLEGPQIVEGELKGVPAFPFHAGELKTLLVCSADLGHEWSTRLILVN